MNTPTKSCTFFAKAQKKNRKFIKTQGISLKGMNNIRTIQDQDDFPPILQLVTEKVDLEEFFFAQASNKISMETKTY